MTQVFCFTVWTMLIHQQVFIECLLTQLEIWGGGTRSYRSLPSKIFQSGVGGGGTHKCTLNRRKRVVTKNSIKSQSVSCSVVSQFFAMPRTVALQAPLSMTFSRQEYWSGLPCPPPLDLPKPRIETASLVSPDFESINQYNYRLRMVSHHNIHGFIH